MVVQDLIGRLFNGACHAAGFEITKSVDAPVYCIDPKDSDSIRDGEQGMKAYPHAQMGSKQLNEAKQQSVFMTKKYGVTLASGNNQGMDDMEQGPKAYADAQMDLRQLDETQRQTANTSDSIRDGEQGMDCYAICQGGFSESGYPQGGQSIDTMPKLGLQPEPCYEENNVYPQG